MVLVWRGGGRHRRRRRGDEHTHRMLKGGKAQNYNRTNTWLISARTSVYAPSGPRIQCRGLARTQKDRDVTRRAFEAKPSNSF
ncbi:hypothetical protein E2C01_005954 [Portunus trituberculatus]|uniref:Uncharacterized protein n=1 Tax=Portunus trituberculatus TaxID=210409 RepID=A0A5B7CUZ4_PORTR|nr:hypothetical protein [Portunus trituberculatus]